MLHLDKAIQINENVSNLLYIRGIIKAYLELYEEAIEDFSKAIDKAEDNVPEQFFYRGLIQSVLFNFNDAIGDFTIAANIKNDYYQAF